MATSPSVSVVIPAYNRAHSLASAVGSVLQQTHRDLEVVVVDDGSQDDTPLLATELSRQDERVCWMGHSTNLGAQAARNTGIAQAHGEWIAFLDSDDEWLPTSLELRLQLAGREQVEVVHSECFIRRDGEKRQTYGVPRLQGRVYRDLLCRPGPVFPALLVAKAALERIGYLDESIISWQEWDTSIRLARHHCFGFVPEPTFVYDCRGEDMMSANLLKAAQGYEQVVRKHRGAILGRAGLRALSRHYETAGSRYDRAGDRPNARRCAWLALIWWPPEFRRTSAWKRVRRLFHRGSNSPPV